MIQLDEQARTHLDGYLNQVKIHLRGCKSVDAGEVVNDVQEHIERELQEIPEPISYNDVDAVLTKLGSPTQWVPAEGLTWWQQFVSRMRSGPEDWRLAYLSFGLLVLGFILQPLQEPQQIAWGLLLALPILLLIGPPLTTTILLASFCTSRACISATVARNEELGAQKWFIYPSLILVYIPLFLALLLVPIPLLFGSADALEHSHIDAFPWNMKGELAYWSIAFMFIIALTGLWWFLLGCVHKIWPKLFNVVFRPFAENIKPAAINLLMGIAVAIFMICSALGVLMIIFPGWYDYLKKFE
ncbi:MAG: hypothetical protein JSV03_06155 [Planctomycetota bacterium]|nr:MAG: hypothetical protein JSV03_06155 [Planctomycetota bacterium]